jgi:hypothetical protein
LWRGRGGGERFFESLEVRLVADHRLHHPRRRGILLARLLAGWLSQEERARTRWAHPVQSLGPAHFRNGNSTKRGPWFNCQLYD